MKARRVKNLDPGTSLGENAARIVRVRLRELTSFAPKAVRPENAREQHDMRIAAKRLRYILEVTDVCFGPAASKARRRARDLQDIIGELHDCDEMLPRVESHIRKLREDDLAAVRGWAAGAPDLDPGLAAKTPNRANYRGLQVLAVYFEARRAVLHDRLLEFWTAQERDGTWDRLDREAKAVLAGEQVAGAEAEA